MSGKITIILREFVGNERESWQRVTIFREGQEEAPRFNELSYMLGYRLVSKLLRRYPEARLINSWH